MARSKPVVGLDIGSSSIKMIQLKETKHGFALHNLGVAPLPPEAIVDGALMNSTAIVDAIQELMAAQGVKRGKPAALAISGHSVIIKKIAMPVMTREELEESIQWEAEQYIPFDISEVNLDVEILQPEGNEAGQMDVLLVAAKKDMISDYTSVVSEAGMQPVVVDVDAFAVQNAFETSYGLPESETIVLVNVGASVVNINVISGGMSVFTRDVSMGGNQFTEDIQKQLNVSYDEAEALKLGGEMGSDIDSVVPQEVERVIQQVSDQMAGEIQRSLDFFAATSADSGFSRIYLAGGSAKIPALFKAIESRAGVPVEIFNPFRGIEIDDRRFDPNYITEVAPMSAVVVGLGLRKTMER
jgi:type IV pilus assembly protein PilM